MVWAQKWVDRAKAAGLDYSTAAGNLPHFFTRAGVRGQHSIEKWMDTGSLRPWTIRRMNGRKWKKNYPQMQALYDFMREGMSVLEIAVLTRRDPDDVFALCAICRWMVEQAAREGTYDLPQEDISRLRDPDNRQ